MSPGLPILYICAVGGLLIIAASFLLLWKRRIFLDRTTKKVTEIELPFGIKAKTQAPVLILILIGGALLMFSVVEVRLFGEEVSVDGNVKGPASTVEMFASVASQALPRGGGEFTLTLPVTHPNRKYTLLYAVDGILIAHQIIDPAAVSTPLQAIELDAPPAPKLVGEIDPVPAGY